MATDHYESRISVLETKVDAIGHAIKTSAEDRKEIRAELTQMKIGWAKLAMVWGLISAVSTGVIVRVLVGLFPLPR